MVFADYIGGVLLPCGMVRPSPVRRPQPEHTSMVRVTQNMIAESLHESVNARFVVLGVLDM
jgi:hypothetical protein